MAMEQILNAIDACDGDLFATYLSPRCEFRAPGFTATGPAPAWAWMSAFLQAFPGIEHRLVSRVEADGREAAEVAITGTHTAPLVSAQGELPASGRPIAIEACDMLTFDADGKVSSYHIYFDQAGFLAQIGVGG